MHLLKRGKKETKQEAKEIKPGVSEALTHVRQFNSTARKEQPADPLTQRLSEYVEGEIEQESLGRRLFSESAAQAYELYHDGPPARGAVALPLAASEDDYSVLTEITTELRSSWKSAVEELCKQKGSHSTELKELLEAPSSAKLEKIVRDAQTELEAKRRSKGGIIRGWFTKVGIGINNHKHLLDMLPTGDNYTSVLTGGITACIKATAEHQDVTELIFDFLERMSDHSHNLKESARLAVSKKYNQSDIQAHTKSHIAKFYSKLFGLLTFVLKNWLLSRWHRVLNSFGTTFKDVLRQEIDRLDYHIRQLQEGQNSIMRGEISQMSNMLGALCQAFLVGSAQDSSRVPEASGYTPFINLMQTGHAPGVLPGLPILPVSRQAGDQPSREICEVPSTLTEPKGPSWTSQTIADSTNWMKTYIQSTRTAELIKDSSYLYTDTQVYYCLLDWMKSPSSEAFWLEGPPTPGETSSNTLTSALIVATFQKLHIPIISHFCYYNSADWRTYSLDTELLKMVYALIAQLVPLIPQDLSSDIDGDHLPDFSPERIQTLTPDPNSNEWDTKKLLPSAISLLADLLPQGPLLFACCIDGLQTLDDTKPAWYESCLKEFIKVLATIRPQPPSVMKLWLSTDGNCRALQEPVRKKWLQSDITESEDQTEPLDLSIMDAVR
ncbi:hypothetical protein BJX70DRAFT_147313 [Aspergillus crustosus]